MEKSACDAIDEFSRRLSVDPRKRMEWYLSLVVMEYIRYSSDSFVPTQTKAIAIRDVFTDFLRIIDLHTFDICSFQRLFHDLLESYLKK